MNDYIKREDAINAIGIRWGKKESPAKDIKRTIYRNLVAIHSADVAPVRHGRWKHERLPSTSGGSYAVVRCSVCEYQYPTAETRYCPNCGAKMDEEAAQWTE